MPLRFPSTVRAGGQLPPFLHRYPHAAKLLDVRTEIAWILMVVSYVIENYPEAPEIKQLLNNFFGKKYDLGLVRDSLRALSPTNTEMGAFTWTLELNPGNYARQPRAVAPGVWVPWTWMLRPGLSIVFTTAQNLKEHAWCMADIKVITVSESAATEWWLFRHTAVAVTALGLRYGEVDQILFRSLTALVLSQLTQQILSTTPQGGSFLEALRNGATHPKPTSLGDNWVLFILTAYLTVACPSLNFGEESGDVSTGPNSVGIASTHSHFESYFEEFERRLHNELESARWFSE